MSGTDPNDPWGERFGELPRGDDEPPAEEDVGWPAEDLEVPGEGWREESSEPMEAAEPLGADEPTGASEPAEAAEPTEGPTPTEGGEPPPGPAEAEEPARQQPPPTEAGTPVVGMADETRGAWDTRRWGERRKPTTAEQAVPWLIGLILALAGIVIVLLVLIFTDTGAGVGAAGSQSPSLEASVSSNASPSPSEMPSESPSASVSATPIATPAPTYGTLEMLYLGRPTALAASELFRDDFSTAAAARVIAKASVDITHYAIAPDGTVAAAIVSGKLMAIVPGKSNRTLAASADAVTFGRDASTVFAVAVAREGTTDDATIWSIAFASGKATKLTTINFHHPAADQLTTLGTARFFDEGGTYRLYATTDGNLVFWVSNGGQWRIDPVNGSYVPVSRQPVLWSPEGQRRITSSENGLVTTLSLVDASGNTTAKVSFTGLISHLRWSPKGTRVVFTLGRNSAGGGVRQDLYTWDLVAARQPVALTADGASFGADWLGVAEFWQP